MQLRSELAGLSDRGVGPRCTDVREKGKEDRPVGAPAAPAITWTSIVAKPAPERHRYPDLRDGLWLHKPSAETAVASAFCATHIIATAGCARSQKSATASNCAPPSLISSSNLGRQELAAHAPLVLPAIQLPIAPQLAFSGATILTTPP